METIVIILEGGAIQFINGIPPGIAVEVRDFDCNENGSPESTNIKVDEHGFSYWETVWI